MRKVILPWVVIAIINGAVSVVVPKTKSEGNAARAAAQLNYWNPGGTYLYCTDSWHLCFSVMSTGEVQQEEIK